MKCNGIEGSEASFVLDFTAFIKATANYLCNKFIALIKALGFTMLYFLASSLPGTTHTTADANLHYCI